jgi:outer membrane protein OmpA-like peptidoglycan-associated protein
VRNDPVTHLPIYEPILYVGSEGLASVGVRYAFDSRFGIGAEALAVIPLDTSDACTGACKNGDLAADALAGLFVQVTPGLSLSVAGGLGVIPDAARAETFRVLVGLSWSPAQAPSASNGDRDGDGIPDKLDNCPDEPEDLDGFQDADGCPDPDNDKDGVPDEEDRCPNEPGPASNHGCPMSGPEPDRDGDGIPDRLDRCPDEPEDVDGFEDADGCPDPDNDGDGIPDKDDKCPNEPEDFNGYQDADGCPDQVVQGGPKMAADRIDLQGDRIEFVGKTAKWTPASQPVIDAVATVMLKNPNVRVRIEVGVERSGNDKRARDADLKLTAERARALSQYLLGKGIKPAQLDVAPLGSDRPIDGKHPADPRVNRRIEFIRVNQ